MYLELAEIFFTVRLKQCMMNCAALVGVKAVKSLNRAGAPTPPERHHGPGFRGDSVWGGVLGAHIGRSTLLWRVFLEVPS